MKKIFLLMAASVVMAVAAHAQTAEKEIKSDKKQLHKEEKTTKEELRNDRKELRKLEGGEVSYQSQQAFSRDFQNTSNDTWERSPYYDKVTFTDNRGNRLTAYYDYHAELVGTTSRKSFNELPLKAQNQINKKYSGFSKEEIILFRDNQDNDSDIILGDYPISGPDNYFVGLKNANIEFIVQVDMDGNVSFFKKL